MFSNRVDTSKVRLGERPRCQTPTYDHSWRVVTMPPELAQHYPAHLVQHAEDMVMIHQLRDGVHGRPGLRLEEALAEFGKGDVVHGLDLPHVAFPTWKRKMIGTTD